MPEITQGTTINNLNGLFKLVYGPELKDLQPKDLKLQNLIKFSERSRHGDSYNVPVLLQREHGFTYAKSESGAFALSGNIPGATKNAQVRGSELVMQGALPYDAASRSTGGNRRAFMQASSLLVTNMWESAKRRLEISMFYGQASIGKISNVASTVLTIDEAEFAPGIWSGMEGAKVMTADTVAYAGGSNITVKNVSTTIQAVDLTNRTITVSSAAGIVTGQHLYFQGELSGAIDTAVAPATTHENFIGMHGIMSTTGDLFNIATSTYSLWKASSVSAGNDDLSFNVVQQATARATAKGMNEDCTLIIPSKTWANLMTDQGALRRFTGSDGGRGSYEIGAESIAFWTQTGKLEVVPSIYCKNGYAYLICPKDWDRVGSSDTTFQRPGADGQFFRELSQNAGYELRAWSDQALFCSAPGKSVLVNQIINS